MRETIYESDFQSKSGCYIKRKTDNFYCSEKDGILKNTPVLDMPSSNDLESNMLKSVHGGPGSSAMKEYINFLSACSGTKKRAF